MEVARTEPGTSNRLGEMLVAGHLVTSEQLERALEQQSKTGEFLGETLVKLGLIEPAVLGPIVAGALGYGFVELTGRSFDSEVARRCTESFSRRKKVLPFEENEHRVDVAMSDPLDIATIDAVSYIFSKRVNVFFAFSQDINEAIGRVFDVRHKAASVLSEIAESDRTAEASVDELIGMAEDAPVVRLVNSILSGAINAGASDIHIEPHEREARVRFRLDGVMYDQMTMPKHHLGAVNSRIKIMGRMNISERRRPQDGRFSFEQAGKEYDLRVSIMSTTFGEKTVMRVLEKQSSLNVDRLGFFPEQTAMFRKFVRKTHGIVLVTGPTGSGKSTTLYAALQEINNPSLNINTIEDPVEYQLSGVNQIQVNPKIGVTFATGLRTLVRQDPDIIMVGEIRDHETAEIAVQAALTGHLVLSTLHTNDAPSAVTRLQNMGVEPYLISSALIGSVAQRLVRTVCKSCQQPVPLQEGVAETLGLDHQTARDAVTLMGKGCRKCNGVGMKGRTSVYEIMPMSEALRDAVIARRSSSELKEIAVREGMLTMRQAGTRKILEGQTTPDEVLRVLSTEE